MNTKIKRGAFILFEGCDRCGKSTQAKLLSEAFTKRNIKHLLLAFPDRTTEIGKSINDYLKSNSKLNDQTIHLLFSANRWEKLEFMKNCLSEGITLIVDRYVYSGIAFSVAKGLDYSWCKSPDVGLLMPDLTFFLNIDPAASSLRAGFGAERYENVEFQSRVYNTFLTHFFPPPKQTITSTNTNDSKHCDKNNNINNNYDNRVVLDAELPVDHLHVSVLDSCLSLLNNPASSLYSSTEYSYFK